LDFGFWILDFGLFDDHPTLLLSHPPTPHPHEEAKIQRILHSLDWIGWR
jgi:hypothetical protein